MSDNPLLSLLSDVDKRFKKGGEKFLTMSEVDETYAVQDYISTGLPSLDLHLMSGVVNGKVKYGIPTGRITEIHGGEASGKSLLANMLMARSRRLGGLPVKFSSEIDIDTSWERSFYESEGLDFDEDVAPYVRYQTIPNIGTLTLSFQTFLSSIRDAVGDGRIEKMPPSVWVIDSLAAMMGDDDSKRFAESYILSGSERKSRIDDDGVVEQPNLKVGDTAKGLHMFFKSALQDLAQYNIALFVTNQMRAKLDAARFGPKEKPAHDSAIRYNASLRLRINRYGAFENSVTRGGREYSRSYKVYISVVKIRGQEVGNGTVELVFRPGTGFDYLLSLIDAFKISGLAKPSTRGLKFDTELEFPYKDELLEVISYMDGRTENDIKQYLLENIDAMIKLEEVVYHLGPLKIDENGELTR